MLELPDHRLRQREYLLQISRAITAQLDLPSVLGLVIRFAVEMLAGTSGFIALYDEEGDDDLRILASTGLPRDIWPAFAPLLAMPLQHTPHEEVVRVLRQVAADSGLSLRQLIALPLVVRHAPLGLIFVFRAALNVAFSTDDEQVLQAFADQAAIAVSNARLYQGVVREKQRLDAMIEQSADGVMIIDHRWRITTFNRAMEQMTGWPREEALGLPCAEVLGFRDANQRNLCLTDCPLQRHPEIANPVVEGWVTTRDGRAIYAQSRYAPQRGPRGSLLGALANVRDITERKREEELQGTFISIVSHELKTPVSIIKGYAGTLRREDAEWTKETLREGLRIIEEEADRLAQQIQDLLDVSRFQANGMRLDFADWSLASLAASVVQGFAAQTAGRFEFELRFADELAPVHADYERIRMVLANLVSNAIKYSPEGGTIRMGARTDGDWMVAYVSDQGIGIPPEEHERVFERFYRVDNRLKREAQGVGLGLYLSRAIIDAHGGRIWVESQLGRGARFRFTLPLARRQIEGGVAEP